MSGETFDNLQATTIDEVITSLDRIISWSKARRSRMGYFPALYRKVTIRVKEGIANGEFEDGARMERLDVIFANRYLEAFEAKFKKAPITESWKVAFTAARRWRPIVLQHLLLGMNAHIDLDLGIAAAETAPPGEVATLKDDFFRINKILGELVNGVQDELAQVWPVLKFLDKIAGKTDEALANFGMKLTRGHAWKVAQDLSALPPEQREEWIASLDTKVANFGSKLLFRNIFIATILFFIRLMEMRSVPRIIEILE